MVDFLMPEKGALAECNRGDTFRRLHQPVIGRVFVARFQQLLSLLPEGERFGRVLEVGFGGGIFVPSLLQVADEVVAVDFESDPDKAASNVREMGFSDAGVTFLREDVFNLPLEEKFDLITGVSVFQQISDLDRLLKRFSEMLNPGGVVLAGIPRLSRLITILMRATGGHKGVNKFNVTTFEEFLDAAKPYFTLVSKKHLFSFLPESTAIYHTALLRVQARS